MTTTTTEPSERVQELWRLRDQIRVPRARERGKSMRRLRTFGIIFLVMIVLAAIESTIQTFERWFPPTNEVTQTEVVE